MGSFLSVKSAIPSSAFLGCRSHPRQRGPPTLKDEIMSIVHPSMRGYVFVKPAPSTTWRNSLDRARGP
ncbi:MAG: hypothetical protein CM15mP128_4540 [Methanobacteriota archaeon]|nr:MAG: hypothetical protein CM15mP128_4540 [Euryarchaeota archaeon]